VGRLAVPWEEEGDRRCCHGVRFRSRYQPLECVCSVFTKDHSSVSVLPWRAARARKSGAADNGLTRRRAGEHIPGAGIMV
jgi:hypothetical protein